MENQGEIILYQPDNEVKLEVRLEEETLWLTQAQIVELFQSSKANISEHIKNIYEQEELNENATVRDFRTVRQEGKGQAVFSYAILQRVEHFVPSGHALEFVTMGTWYLSARSKAAEAEKDAGSDARPVERAVTG